ncbi:FtsW/RodA/SpoVE family cell cycle protein [Mobilitalea sibirica]|uniref:FtsW/RodA/SpoVE family cell cycle protein n=1 Tax=Mobilitalea sibirica TaxID=1462919 RepID=A0A8J7H2Q6_9FIRM|nr:FtsW/RodA/SpoVE family cell cycle protein [Mobilitalea sibirica]MBH1940875.1 FtsW/RodA/SpoVE family cell cycle protein [Mobilitalea sibirica]
MFKFKQYDFKRYNISMLIVVILLGAIGSFLIKQVQLEDENLFMKQIVGLAGGILIAIFVSLIDYHFMCKFYIVLYLINLVLLVLVRVAGVERNNARRWLDLKFFEFQPSEISKIILILFMAKLFTIFKDKINNAFVLLLAIITMALPTFLILTQTDLSTSMVLMFIFAMLVFASGLSWKIILPILLVGIPSFVGLFWYVQQDYQVLLSPYQQRRILSILNPEEYAEIMFQQDNSIQAIGSGQLLGKQFIESTSDIRGYNYVPISESDFIFSVAGEELGFIGSCIIILLFGAIIYKCLVTAKKAPDQMGMLIAVGIASLFVFQVFVNIGVATALLPNTGIPLPFLSSGLSSLLSSMIAIGIVLNIRLQPKKSRG